MSDLADPPRTWVVIHHANGDELPVDVTGIPTHRIGPLRDALDAAIRDAEARGYDRAMTLVRPALLFGTGYRWRRPDGEVLVLDPTEVDVFVPADTPATPAEAEARGYQRAIDALRDRAKRETPDGLRVVFATAADYLESLAPKEHGS